MDGRRWVGLVGAAALVAPLAVGTTMPAAASGTSAAAAAVPASTCFPSTDNGDPVLTTFTISPAVVDARTRAQVVTFTATADDTGGPGPASGLRDAHVYLGLGDGNYNIDVELVPDGEGALAGTLTVLPQFRNTTRTVEGVTVTDRDDNSTNYLSADLAELGLPTTFVTRTDADLVKPALDGLRLSSATIDSRRHSRVLVVTVKASDDSAGVHSVQVNLNHVPYTKFMATTLRLVDGSVRRGTWRGRIKVGRWQATSTRRLHVEVYDAVGNRRVYSHERLAAQGRPSSVRIISGDDRVAPTVRVRSVTPTSVDLRTGAQTVTVVARVRDAGAVRRVRFGLASAPRPDGGQATVDVRLARVSGTARDGLWRGSVTLRPCAAPAGVWTGSVGASDAVTNGNGVPLGREISVVNADVVRPTAQITGNSYQVRRAGPVTVEFDEDVVGIGGADVLVHVGDPQEGRPGDEPAPIPGVWTCATAGAAPVDCLTGPVRTAVFTPTAPMAAATNYTVALNPEHHLGVTDLAGNPFAPGWGLGFHTA